MIPLWQWLAMTDAERAATPLGIMIDLTQAERGDRSKFASERSEHTVEEKDDWSLREEPRP